MRFVLKCLVFWISFFLSLPAAIHAAGAGNALDFDGTDDHVQVADDDSLDLTTQGSLEAWVYLSGTVDNAGIVHKGDGSTGEAYSLRFGYGTENDRVKLVVTDDSGTDTLLSDTALILKNWYHVAGTWDDTDNMTLYINGVQDVSASCNRSARNTSEKLLIGARYDFGTDAVNGRIDEVRVWNDLRSEDEIQNNMCKSLTGSEDNLAAYWRFDETSGTECTDSDSENTNTGNMTYMDPATDRIYSGAAIGNESDSNYSFGTRLSLSHTDGDKITVSDITGSPEGVHLYRVDSAPDQTTSPMLWKGFGAAQRYWGVFMTGGSSPTYDITYEYAGYPGIVNENGLKLAYRHGGADGWKALDADLNTSAQTLSKEDLSGTEFILGSEVDPRNAIDFDGSDEYVGVSDEASLDLGDTGTIEAWIYPETFATGAGIVHKGTTGTAYGFGLAGGGVFPGGSGQNIGFNAYDTTLTDTTTTLLADKWYHVACTWDSSSTDIYINGVQNTPSGGGVTAGTNKEELRFGMQEVSDPAVYFDGGIDEVRIWNDARSQEEIRDYMCQKLTGSEDGLVGYWRFDQESTSTTCPDYDFGTANDGTMKNFGDVLAARVCSSAPIGDASARDYEDDSGGPVSAQLSHPDGDYMFATENAGNWTDADGFSGLHIYRLDEAPVYPPDIGTNPYPESPNGLTPPPGWASIDYARYWGVFVTDWATASQPTYDVAYHYGSNPGVPADEKNDQYTVALARRDSHYDRTWATATTDESGNVLTVTGDSQNDPSKTYPEYVLGGTAQPLMIRLASFTGRRCESGNCNRLQWETAAEVDVYGFYILRSDQKQGPYKRLEASFTEAKGRGQNEGAVYTYRDYAFEDPDKVYYYKLEEEDNQPEKTNPVFGPVKVGPTGLGLSENNGRNDGDSDDNGFLGGCFVNGICPF